MKTVPSNGNDCPILHGYLDLIDISLHTFLSYNFFLRVVDPIQCYGFATVLHSDTKDNLKRDFDCLISIMHAHPQTIYYSVKTSFALECSHVHNSIDFIELSHFPSMKVE